MWLLCYGKLKSALNLTIAGQVIRLLWVVGTKNDQKQIDAHLPANSSKQSDWAFEIEVFSKTQISHAPMVFANENQLEGAMIKIIHKGA